MSNAVALHLQRPGVRQHQPLSRRYGRNDDANLSRYEGYSINARRSAAVGEIRYVAAAAAAGNGRG